MKTLIQKYQTIIMGSPSVIVRALALVAFVLFVNSLDAQTVDCNTTMACNDAVQVSLDESCRAEILPDMILEDPIYPDSYYTVVIMDMAGNQLPSNILNYAHVNQTFNVSIKLNGCPSSCWGTISIEDKLPPTIVDCTNLVVECDDNLTPGSSATPKPTATDACSSVTFDYHETMETNACANDFIKTITRAWTFTDAQGNESSCTQIIFVKKATIADVDFPLNYDNIEQDAFECNTNLELLDNGAPSPEETGYPSNVGCANIQVYYTDVIFDICGASIKVLRQWTVIDWCTGEEKSDNQIIKILDNSPPVCSAPPDYSFDITTDDGQCTGTFTVPKPIIIFECSEWTYTVGYKLRDEDGQPFENPIYDNITYNPNTQLYTITGLPQDTSWIVYTITDACNNSSQCFTEVMVEDDEAPTPVCEGYTVVGLEDIGWADIFATSIDDGSTDNCEVVKYEVKRQTTNCGMNSDLQFGEKVNFCCNDVAAGYIKVVLRVYDAAGNYNDCVVNVNVQDKINPTITCPANITLSCTQDYTDFTLTGNAIGEDNCSVVVTHTDQESFNDCGIGYVLRTFKATDPQGRTATCTQRITIGDNTPFNANNIQWPSDRNLNGCDGSNATPEELNSFPVLSNDDCANIAISYDDNTFYNVQDYCIKILRHWKVVDWCNYDPQNPQFYEYVQKITISNSQIPTIEACENITVVSEDGDCQESITASVSATDDCTPANKLKYSWTIDLNSNGSVDMTGVTNSLTRVLSSGTHSLIWSVEDACGNVAV
ncbi:MAG: hypothetical protein V3V14_12640, partial [Saprospiraceae bacterium]